MNKWILVIRLFFISLLISINSLEVFFKYSLKIPGTNVSDSNGLYKIPIPGSS